ncbi:MAG: hypothetical protein E5V58_11335 [Mesorhizobium sp.]|nr:MAG: hypothetical protein E5V58_11335 [Mesorhizobium sp.]
MTLERTSPQCAISSTRLREALVRCTLPLRPPRNSVIAVPTTEKASGKVTQACSNSPSLTSRVVVSDFSCSSRLRTASWSARSLTTPSARRSSLMSFSVSTSPPSDRLSGLQLAITGTCDPSDLVRRTSPWCWRPVAKAISTGDVPPAKSPPLASWSFSAASHCRPTILSARRPTIVAAAGLALAMRPWASSTAMPSATVSTMSSMCARADASWSAMVLKPSASCPNSSLRPWLMRII